MKYLSELCESRETTFDPHLLEYMAALGRIPGMNHWQKDAEAAGLLAGIVRNDHI